MILQREKLQNISGKFQINVINDVKQISNKGVIKFGLLNASLKNSKALQCPSRLGIYFNFYLTK